jgi:hypothetical protein
MPKYQIGRGEHFLNYQCPQSREKPDKLISAFLYLVDTDGKVQRYTSPNISLFPFDKEIFEMQDFNSFVLKVSLQFCPEYSHINEKSSERYIVDHRNQS